MEGPFVWSPDSEKLAFIGQIEHIEGSVYKFSLYIARSRWIRHRNRMGWILRGFYQAEVRNFSAAGMVTRRFTDRDFNSRASYIRD